MNRTQQIRRFSGPIIATAIHKPNGDIELRKFAGPILGTYSKSSDTVRKFAGPVISSGCGSGPLFTLVPW